jgi:hypothetical protein
MISPLKDKGRKTIFKKFIPIFADWFYTAWMAGLSE